MTEEAPLTPEFVRNAMELAVNQAKEKELETLIALIRRKLTRSHVLEALMAAERNGGTCTFLLGYCTLDSCLLLKCHVAVSDHMYAIIDARYYMYQFSYRDDDKLCMKILHI